MEEAFDGNVIGTHVLPLSSDRTRLPLDRATSEPLQPATMEAEFKGRLSDTLFQLIPVSLEANTPLSSVAAYTHGPEKATAEI